MSNGKPIRYILGLDGLRAIAVLAVIAYHLDFDWASGGFLGVTIFFVLSGYLITNLLLIEWEFTNKINLKDFWIKRARRLLPGMFLMLFVITAWVTVFNPSFLAKLQEDFLASIFYVNNWWYIFQDLSYFEMMSGAPSLLTHFWSLAVEEQFYIIWPLLICCGLVYQISKKQFVALTMLVACLSALLMAALYNPAIDPSRIYYGTDTRAFSLLIGAALAFVWPSHKLTQTVPKAARMAMDCIGGISLITLLFCMVYLNQYDSFIYQGGMVFVSLVTAVLIAVLVHPSSRLTTILQFKPLVWIGMRSYGIYLWHYPVILLTKPAIDTGGMNLWRIAFQLILTIILAALSYKYIENPIRRGAIGQFLKRVREKKWHLKQVTFTKWAAIACTISILCISATGLLTKSSVLESSQEELKHEMQVSSIENIEIQNPSTNASSTEIEEEVQPSTDSVENEENQIASTTEDIKPVDYKITAIGDSVIIDAIPFLTEQFPNITVDAQVGRQMSAAFDVINSFKQNGNLGDYVVIALGTNGVFNEEQLASLIDTIGKEKHITLINTRVPRQWESVVNKNIQSITTTYPSIKIVDWYEASSNHNEYFAPDGVHLTRTGAKVYADLIAEQIMMN